MRKSVIHNQQGFSLVEAMIAMVILSIGLMAVGLMQISAMKSNTNALSRSDGVAISQSVMDTLRCLPLNDIRISDVDTSAVNLNDGSSVGGANPVAGNAGHQGDEIFATNPILGSNGQSYNIFWNIDDDTPIEGAKTLRLFVYWTDQRFGLNRVIVTSILGGFYL
ncbi:MAG: prepilin-type N-terminal cleavage/methylation domain-containing protein [Deltaproteobacteria bacterium]|nr:prepilin-type N-terminal cleavage/methylation domain-containing protein [Deltaproteobacteria bacterium]